MNLFQIDEQYNVQIDPIAYTLLPFKTIWDRDKSKTKEKAKAELAFIFFTVDYKSVYYNQPDEEEREKEVIRHLFKENKNKWKPDKIVREAQNFYKDKQKTFSLSLLENAMIGINKLSLYLRDISFDEVEINDKTGEVKPKHDVKKFADTVKTIPDIMKSLQLLEETVKKEQEQKNSLRGGREKGMYADG